MVLGGRPPFGEGLPLVLLIVVVMVGLCHALKVPRDGIEAVRELENFGHGGFLSLMEGKRITGV